MKIQKIAKINECRTFRDYTWPGDLPSFQEYNLIYGWNGTGKTTISDIFRAIERKSTDLNGEFNVVTDQSTVKSEDLEGTWGASIPPIRVFNRDYVQANIFPPDDEAITPIFYLGEKSVEKQKLVEAKTAQLQTERSQQQAELELKRQKEKDLDDLSIKGAKAVKDALLSSGSNPYNTYNKGGFKSTIGNMIDSGVDATTFAQTDEEKAELKARFSGTLKESIGVKPFTLPDLAVIRTAVDTVIQRSVVSETLPQLQDDEELSGWVKHGLDIHKQGNQKDCQFCLQPLPAKRIKDLEGHFNDQYSKMMADITATYAKVDAMVASVGNFTFVDKATICDHLVGAYLEAAASFKTVIDSYTDYLAILKTLLDQKKASPFGKISIGEMPPADGQAIYQAYEDVLTQHNTDCAGHANNVADARGKYEDSIVAGYLDEYKAFKKAAADAETKAKTSGETIQALVKEIGKLEMEIKEHRKPAEEINADLMSYLGHDELQFETKENGYIIYRFGEPAKDLSEGEKTAIALLYFLKTLEDKNFKPKGIVVIDDPVSSMDDGALFHAFGYIKAKTKDAQQLFILTHNFMFFRQVKNWFQYVNERKKIPQNASFYQTKCALKLGKRRSEITPIDKLLLDYESEYHYLFHLVHQASLNAGGDLGDYYPMPNVARRVLESFLAFRNPSVKGRDRLYTMLELTDYDMSLKTKILRFVHSHSHEDNIGAPQHDPSLLAETPHIMRSILDLIKKVDQGHYDEMIKVVAPPALGAGAMAASA